MKKILASHARTFFLMFFLFGSSGVHAALVYIDTDPLTAGAQSSFNTAIGNTLTINVMVDELDSISPLNAFEFDLDFNPFVLTATGITSGNFLPNFSGTLLPLVVESDITAPDVNYAEVTIGFFGSSGGGILATITFDVIGNGTSFLDLNDVILSAPFGEPIALTSIGDATITANPTNVPLPPTFLLFMLGISFIKFFDRSQKRL